VIQVVAAGVSGKIKKRVSVFEKNFEPGVWPHAGAGAKGCWHKLGVIEEIAIQSETKDKDEIFEMGFDHSDLSGGSGLQWEQADTAWHFAAVIGLIARSFADDA